MEWDNLLHTLGGLIFIFLTSVFLYKLIAYMNDRIKANIDNEDCKEIKKEITERKIQSQRLLDILPDGVIIVQNFKIFFANQKAIELMGKNSLEEVKGKPVLDTVSPDFVAIAKKRIKALTLGKVDSVPNMRGKWKSIDDRIIDVEVTAKATLIDGKRSMVFVIRDISIRAKMEKKLKETNNELESTVSILKDTQSKMVQQEKLAGIGQLAAGIAHEINNPLGFISSNFSTLDRYHKKIGELLKEYDRLKELVSQEANTVELKKQALLITDYMDKNQIPYLIEDTGDLMAETNEGINRVDKIVKAMRVFSRIDRLNEKEDYDLNVGIENTLIVANNEIKYNAQVHENFGDIPLIKAIGDKVNQVLLNILVNAAHAIQEKELESEGSIYIKTYSDDRYVYCEIKDNGVGIDGKNLSSIFNPFFTTKPVGKGTGLGLSIAYDIIVNQHKGELSVISKKGEGTIFKIKLPIS